MRFDLELDYHGYTVTEMLNDLERRRSRPGWRGMTRVLVVHGTGERLAPAVRKWCEHRQIVWNPKGCNPGAIVLHPRLSAPSMPAHGHTGPPARRALTRRRESTVTDHPGPSHQDRQLFDEELERLSRRSSASLNRLKKEG